MMMINEMKIGEKLGSSTVSAQLIEAVFLRPLSPFSAERPSPMTMKQEWRRRRLTSLHCDGRCGCCCYCWVRMILNRDRQRGETNYLVTIHLNEKSRMMDMDTFLTIFFGVRLRLVMMIGLSRVDGRWGGRRRRYDLMFIDVAHGRTNLSVPVTAEGWFVELIIVGRTFVRRTASEFHTNGISMMRIAVRLMQQRL